MVTVEPDGSLVFRVYLPHAQSVALVADFTSWGDGRIPLEREHGPVAGRTAGAAASDRALTTPPRAFDRDDDASRPDRALPATPEPDGWWIIRTRAPEGDHAFSYLIDNHWWLPDYAAHGVQRNAEGRWTSLLFVPPAPRLAARPGPRMARLSGAAAE